MTRHHIPSVAALAGAAATIAIIAAPGGSQAASSTQTLRFYDKQASIKLTHADGTAARPPFSEPQPGDVLEVNSLDYRGTHARHEKHWSATTHLVCRFGTGAPDCVSHVAVGSSMLVFSGNPATVTNGTGVYQGATGRVLFSKDIAGTDDTDVVVRIRLRR